MLTSPLVPAQLPVSVVADGVKQISASHELRDQHGIAVVLEAGPHELQHVQQSARRRPP